MTNPCQIDGCNRPHKARGLCELHYRRDLRRGTTELIEPKKRACQVESCDESARSNGYCPVHFRAWARHGDPLVKVYGVKQSRKCLLNDCTRTQFQRELCKTHYPNYRYHLSRNNCVDVGEYVDFKNGQTQKVSGNS